MTAALQSQPPAAGEAAHTTAIHGQVDRDGCYLTDSRGTIASCSFPGLYGEERHALAIAEEIRRRCNSHAALVAALEKAQEEISYLLAGRPTAGKWSGPRHADAQKTLSAIRAALNAANAS